VDGDGDGELILGELTHGDNRILIPCDFTQNDIIGDPNLCDPDSLSRVSIEAFSFLAKDSSSASLTYTNN
jgi:hypothetical protein